MAERTGAERAGAESTGAAGAVLRIAAAVRAAPARAGRTRVLAIDGPSGAGKTTLAAAVGASLDAPVLGLDDVYPGWDGLAAAVPRLVDGVLRPLSQGRAAGYRRWDWAAGRDAEWVRLPFGTGAQAPPVLVVEGAGAGALPCAPYLSVLVWLEAPAVVRFARAMARDGDGYRPHWRRWAAQEDAYFAAHDPRGRADLRLVSEDP